MAVKNYGYSLESKGGEQDEIWRWYPTYSRKSLTFPTKQDQLTAVVDAYRGGLTRKQYELINVRGVVNRYGEEDGDDRTHGIVKPSPSRKYGAMFKPSGWFNDYEYDLYYVSDKGRLIPAQRY